MGNAHPNDHLQSLPKVDKFSVLIFDIKRLGYQHANKIKDSQYAGNMTLQKLLKKLRENLNGQFGAENSV